MRHWQQLVFGVFAIFIFSCASAMAQQTDRADLVDPDFTVPDFSNEVEELLSEFKALAEEFETLSRQQENASLEDLLALGTIPQPAKHFKLRHQLELEVAAEPQNARRWQTLAEDALKHHRPSRARIAAYAAYQRTDSPYRRATALAVMAEAYLDSEEPYPAVNLLKLATDTAEIRNHSRRLEVLIERFSLRIMEVDVDSEGSTPRACIQLNQALAPMPAGELRDFLTLTPDSDVDISVQERRICIRGLEYEQSYTLRLEAGLPAAPGYELRTPLDVRFDVSNRTPRITFGEGSYVLVRDGDKRLPLTTVNTEEVGLILYRIAERNLAPSLLANLIGQDLASYEADRIESTEGEKIWEGVIDTPAPQNEEVTTLVPLDEIIRNTEPGIYALMAHQIEEEEERYWRQRETQWLVISNLGLTVYDGKGGMQVAVRSLTDAAPVANAKLSLVARNNDILGTVRSDRDGLARFSPGLSRGEGGNRPAVVTVETGNGDFNFIELTRGGLDLSERDISGRAYPDALDAFLYTERGVYRPGEKVYLSVLLRDQQAKALGERPLSLKVTRPGGTEMYNETATGDEFGGYLFEIPLTVSARAGAWRAEAFIEDEDTIVGSTIFQVEDFVPQRIRAEVSFEDEILRPDTDAVAQIEANYLYGAPAGGLNGEIRVTFIRDPQPFEKFKKFTFGLKQEEFREVTRPVQEFTTGEDGRAAVPIQTAPLPDTSHPMQARVVASVFDVGGRPVNDQITVPVRNRPVEVGLRKVSEQSAGDSETVAYEAVAVDREGQAVAGRALSWQWVREEYDYGWQRSSGRWHFRLYIFDNVIAGGKGITGEDGLLSMTQTLDSGRYRLDLFDEEGKAAASHRFYVGWWSASTAPDVPDALSITLEEEDLEDRGTLRAFIDAPFAGKALVTVLTDKVEQTRTIDLPEDGTEIELTVSSHWGPGAWLAVTAFRPEAEKPSLLPVRAIGLQWFSIDREKRQIAIEMKPPETARPRNPVTIPLQVDGADGPVKMTIAAVDEGILQLTDFRTPKPGEYYLGKRRLGVTLHDLYGRLIDPAEGEVGQIRSGGDMAGLEMAASRASEENLAGISKRVVKTVALYERDIEPDAEGRAAVTLDLPDFAGQLRLMAVAYGARTVGSGESSLIVRDPLVAEILLPRFLAPGDRVRPVLSLHNLSGEAVDAEIEITVNDILEIGGTPGTVSLEDGERRDIGLTLRAGEIGVGSIDLTVTTAAGLTIKRHWDIQVRPAQPYITQRNVTFLDPGESLDYRPATEGKFLPSTVKAGITLSARPEFNVPALLESLYRYPYGCTEQTISRAMPLLYYADLANEYGVEGDDADFYAAINRAILRTLDRQTPGGGFSTWSPHGGVHEWLTAFAVDFLTRAREEGHDVPKAAFNHAVDWLKSYVARRSGSDYHSQAYAFYVLARLGAVEPGEVRYFANRAGDNIPTRLGYGHLAAALALIGETARANTFYTKALRTFRPKYVYYWDYGSDLRDTAALLALIAETMPAEETPQRVIELLEAEFDGNAYFSTQEKLWLIRATHALTSRPGADLHITLDGREIGPRDESVRLGLDRAALDEGLSVTNEGKAAIRFIEGLRGVPVQTLPAVSNGFEITRKIYTEDGQLTDLSDARQNDVFIVVISGNSTNRMEHEALVVDLLPAGFEIENAGIGGLEMRDVLDGVEEKAKARDNPFRRPDLTRPEFDAARDDRYIAAFNIRGRRDRDFRFAYVMRAVTPGDYVQPAVFIEDMYKPRFHARGAMGRVSVSATDNGNE